MTAIVPDRKWSEDQGRHIPTFVRADELARHTVAILPAKMTHSGSLVADFAVTHNPLTEGYVRVQSSL